MKPLTYYYLRAFRSQEQALLIAAECGYTRTTEILLEEDVPSHETLVYAGLRAAFNDQYDTLGIILEAQGRSKSRHTADRLNSKSETNRLAEAADNAPKH